MVVEERIAIRGSRAAVWAVIADIERAAEILSGVEKIEVVEKPAQGLVGLRWRETRMLFGKPATVEKRITEAAEPEFYRTQAEDGGFVFFTTQRLAEGGAGDVTLASIHETQPQGLVARLMALPMVFFRGLIRKAIRQDLNDLKAAAEGKGSAAS